MSCELTILKKSKFLRFDLLLLLSDVGFVSALIEVSSFLGFFLKASRKLFVFTSSFEFSPRFRFDPLDGVSV